MQVEHRYEAGAPHAEIGFKRPGETEFTVLKLDSLDEIEDAVRQVSHGC